MESEMSRDEQNGESAPKHRKGGLWVSILGAVVVVLWFVWPPITKWLANRWGHTGGESTGTNLGVFGDMFGSLSALFVVGAFLLALYGVVLERRQLVSSEESRKLESAARLESDKANREVAVASQRLAESSLQLNDSTEKLAAAFVASTRAAEKSADASVKLLEQVQNEKRISSETANTLREAATQSSEEIQRAMKAASDATESQLVMAKQLNSAAEKILAGYAEGERLRTESQRVYKEIIDAQKQATLAMSNLYNAQLQDLKVSQFFRRLEYLRDAINALRGTDVDKKLVVGVGLCDAIWDRVAAQVNGPQKRDPDLDNDQQDLQQQRTREQQLMKKLPEALGLLDPIDSVIELVVRLAEWINTTCDVTSITDAATRDFRLAMRDEFGQHLAATVPDKLRALILYSAFSGRLDKSKAKACHKAGLYPLNNPAARIDFFITMDQFIVPVNAGT